jgi:hypothetical protein
MKDLIFHTGGSLFSAPDGVERRRGRANLVAAVCEVATRRCAWLKGCRKVACDGDSQSF